MVKSNVYRKNSAIKDLDLLSSYKKIYRDLQSQKKDIDNDNAVSNLLKKDFKGIKTNLKVIETYGDVEVDFFADNFYYQDIYGKKVISLEALFIH